MAKFDDKNIGRLATDEDEAPPSNESNDVPVDLTLELVRKRVQQAMDSNDVTGLKVGITEGNRYFVIDRSGHLIEVLNAPDEDGIQDSDLRTGLEVLPEALKALKDVSPEEFFRTSQYVYFDLLRFSISPPACNILDLRWKSGDEKSTIFGHNIRSRSGEEITGAEYVLRAAHALGVIPKEKSSINSTEAMETLRLLKMVARRSGNWSEEDVNKAHHYRGPKSASTQTVQAAAETTEQANGALPSEPSRSVDKVREQEPSPQSVPSDTSASAIESLRAAQAVKAFERALQRAEDKLTDLHVDKITNVSEARRHILNIRGAFDDLLARMEDMRKLGVPFNEGEVQEVIENLQDLLVELQRLPAKLRSAKRLKEKEEWKALLEGQGAEMQRQMEEMRTAIKEQGETVKKQSEERIAAVQKEAQERVRKMQEQQDALQQQADAERQARERKQTATSAKSKVNTSIWSAPVQKQTLQSIMRRDGGPAVRQMREQYLKLIGVPLPTTASESAAAVPPAPQPAPVAEKPAKAEKQEKPAKKAA